MLDFDWVKYEEEVRNTVEINNGNPKDSVFFRDGIVNIDEWNKEENCKILFLLKEVNDQRKDENDCKCKKSWRNLVNKEDVCDIFTEYMWRKLAFLATGIQTAIKNNTAANPDEWEFFNSEEGKKTFAEKEQEIAISKVAIMNMKKLGGGGTADSKKSNYTLHYTDHCKMFSEQIKEQIECINPSIIVCCSPDVYENLNKYVYKLRRKNGKFPDTINNRIIVKGYHPSYENRKRDIFKNIFYADTINTCLKIWRNMHNI